jgi:hypothetical protein
VRSNYFTAATLGALRRGRIRFMTTIVKFANEHHQSRAMPGK